MKFVNGEYVVVSGILSDHILWLVTLKLDMMTLMRLLVGVCLAILRADGQMKSQPSDWYCSQPCSSPENT